MAKERKVLCIGKICMDTVTVVDEYPKEDSEILMNRHWLCRGGNAANSSVVLANLNEPTEYFGVVFGDEQKLNQGQTDLIKRMTSVCLQDLKDHNVSYENVVRRHIPTFFNTFIAINKKSGSRTMYIHDCREQEPTAVEFASLNLEKYKWIHFEGRNVQEVIKMTNLIKQFNLSRTSAEQVLYSVELELFSATGVIEIAKNADAIFAGKDFCKNMGFSYPQAAAKGLCNHTKLGANIIVAWGELGAACIQHGVGVEPESVDAIKPDIMVDTMGAGDTFNGACIKALCNGFALSAAVKFACKVASKKITNYGFDVIKGMENQIF